MLNLLRQPRWIILTLLVPVGIVLCLIAADWQYQRHVNRSAEDALARANSSTTPVALTEVVQPGEALPEDDVYRFVAVQGTYLADETVLVRKRVFNGSPGYWVVTPLRTSDGSVVQVLRGWTAMAGDALTSPSVASPPPGEVSLVGWLKPTEMLPQPAPTDLPVGQVAALDTAVLNNSAATGDSAGFTPVMVATASEPADPAGLTPVPVPKPGLGPHLAYSWQWLTFAAMLPIGWVILFRRELKSQREDADVEQHQVVAANSAAGS